MIVEIQAADNKVVPIVADSPDFISTQHTAEDSHTITAIAGTVSIVVVSMFCSPGSHPLEDTHLRYYSFNIANGSDRKTLFYSDCCCA